MKRRSSEVVVTNVFIGRRHRCETRYLEFSITAKKVYYLFIFLIARTGRLFFAFFGQLLFQTALTIAMQHGLVPVLAKVFGDVVFVGVILAYCYNLVKGLQQYAHKGEYGHQFFQENADCDPFYGTKLRTTGIIS